LSSISLGGIYKLEWLFQYNNGQKISQTVLSPEKKDIYSYTYPKSDKDQSYQVVLRTYSGKNCFIQSAPQTITIKASPTLIFNELDPICITSSNLILTAHEKNLLPGFIKFDGKGITDGIFSPSVAGIGKHEIICSFIGHNNCNDTIRRTILVTEIPEVSGDSDLNILLGEEKQFNFDKLTGSDLQYRWTPSIGLSADNILNPIAFPVETTKYQLE